MTVQSKIRTVDELADLSGDLRKAGKTIVLTNGCFDLLHVGHLNYLTAAKALGDVLIVAINTDGSMRRIKGEKRPLNTEADRMQMLAGLSCVDFVTSFDEPDPYLLITRIRPDILVKGGDWEIGQIIGRDFVEQQGGRVVSIPLTAGRSTSRMIERILALYGPDHQ